MRDNREREAEKRKIPTFAYIGVTKYRQRLRTIQEQIYASLAKNDERFGGDDGIEGVLVFGSYAKSFTIAKGRTLVHNRADQIPPSDLDIAYFAKQQLPTLDHLTEDDNALIASTLPAHLRPFMRTEKFMDMYKSPGFRLDALIKQRLEEKHVYTSPEHSQYLNFETPNDMIADLAEGYGSVINEQGLVFIHPESRSRSEILDCLRKARLPMVLDPATTAEVLSPTTT